MVKVFFDTSVLVAASEQGHPHYGQALPALRRVTGRKDQGFMSVHSIAEMYAALTRLPVQPRIHPAEAARIITDNMMPHFEMVPVGKKDYIEALKLVGDGGWGGAKIYDALLMGCAAAVPGLTGFTLSTSRISGSWRRIWKRRYAPLHKAPGWMPIRPGRGTRSASPKPTESNCAILGQGEFYAFGPAVGKPGVVHLRSDQVRTTHPRPGQRHLLTAPAPSRAIRGVLGKFTDLPQEAEEEIRGLDEARRRIAELEREIKRLKGASPALQIDQKAVDRAAKAAVERERAAWQRKLEQGRRA